MSPDDVGERSGAAEGTRTPDPIITNDVLYQLSYSGVWYVAGKALQLVRGISSAGAALQVES